MKLVNLIAPRFTIRRLYLSILRDFIYRPSSIFGRLSQTNFKNNLICRDLIIHCNICGETGYVYYDFPDIYIRKEHSIGLLRETLRCKSCGSTMRDRQMAFGILQEIARRFAIKFLSLAEYRKNPSGTIRILDSDSYSPINRILRGLDNYNYSQYIPNLPNGDRLSDDSIVVDLMNIPFDEKSFDLILSSDVMEHVADDNAAHKSIFRTLDRGGVYIFTVPFDPTALKNRKLTVSTDNANASSHLYLDRHVHGDPHSSSGVTAHRIYGHQLIQDLINEGFATDFITVHEPRTGIYEGDLFIARKEI